jgi:hypothetical protein
MTLFLQWPSIKEGLLLKILWETTSFLFYGFFDTWRASKIRLEIERLKFKASLIFHIHFGVVRIAKEISIEFDKTMIGESLSLSRTFAKRAFTTVKQWSKCTRDVMIDPFLSLSFYWNSGDGHYCISMDTTVLLKRDCYFSLQEFIVLLFQRNVCHHT